MIEAGLDNFSAALANKTPGTYDAPFYYGGSDLVGIAKLTVTDSSAAAAPKLADADVAAARKSADDAWYTDVTINPAAIDAYYEPLVPPVAQAKKPAKAAKKALPQTGDNALAIAGLFGAAGAATAALGVAAKRR